MSNQQAVSANNISVNSLQLPKGGGAIRGFGENLADAGPTGTVTFTVPLPVSSGRGYAPDMALSYHSGDGNDVFGLGWSVPIMQISRRSNRGAPKYTEQDEFIGPDGEVLVPQRDPSNDEIVTRQCSDYDGLDLAKTYTVTRYFPRVEGAFDLIEYWLSNNNDTDNDNFWLIHQADGQLHCLGKQTLTRTAATTDGSRIAQWWLQESVSPTGEHISYQYKAEDDVNVILSGQENQRERGALSYLVQVQYANKTPQKHLYAWDDNAQSQTWLCSLVFDYGERESGERGIDPSTPPAYNPLAPADWFARPDPFSQYHYGFETRCHRLCQQVLMYHHFPDELGEAATLVDRLILSYDQSPVTCQLNSVQQWAYDTLGSPQMLPPLMFDYNQFEPYGTNQGWQSWQALPSFNHVQPYQMVDLYGEGMAGLLYQQDNGWYYRAPTRGASPDEIVFETWQPVPQIPSLANGTLMDITGDSKLDWIVTQPGLNGFFSLNPDKTWTGFTPFSALPVEFFHPQAQLADLMGDGLSDIALIGPKSVRLYANNRSGFDAGQDISQDEGTQLPVIGRDSTAFIGFSDLLGSGQQHLVQIRYNEIKCWPNLGLGRFGAAITFSLPELDTPERFNPDSVYLCDLDGSGANDLIYARHNSIDIYLNLSGNGFGQTPINLPLPADVYFDHLCQLSASDIQGNGTASLILSKPYPQTQHWQYTFCTEKPYLLNATNNNMGAKNQLTYRSSVQFWLDEKSQPASTTICLPFPVHLLYQTIQTDEVTGNRLSQEYCYQKGVYDGKEREFRGFGYIETQDTNHNASASGSDIAFSPPTLTKTWYHTGNEADETITQTWQGDALAYQISPSRLTQYKPGDVEFSGDSNTSWWLYRALNGQVLRQEVYALDDSLDEALPITVSSFRYQSRLCQNSVDHHAPVVLNSLLESLCYQYERIIDDPQSSHQVALELDEFGFALQSVTVYYPRRSAVSATSYPDTLPDTAVASSVDEQQQWLRFSEQKQSYYHLQSDFAWQLGIAWQQRDNERIIESPSPPQSAGYNFEALTDVNSPLNTQAPEFAGQQVFYYTEAIPASLPVLLAHIETAELDENALAAYDDVSDMFPFDGTETLDSALIKAGYLSSAKVLIDDGDDDESVWVIPSNYSTYHPASLFYLPLTEQQTLLDGVISYGYNTKYGFLTQVTDALSNTEIVAQFDYRFLSAVKLLDINNNNSAVAFDAFGRVVATTFYGTEAQSAAGFEPLGATTYQGLSVIELMALSDSATQLSIAGNNAYEPFSWMGTLAKSDVDLIEPTCWDVMVSRQLILVDCTDTTKGYITARGHSWALSSNEPTNALLDHPATITEPLKNLITTASRIPVHSAALVADNYPGALVQHKQVSIEYNDGLGRTLQASSKVESGLAYQRDANGELMVDDDGQLIEMLTTTRWNVSGRIEYNNKGLTVRIYQPYFVNDWQYVVDSSMRTQGFADTLYYDALGRQSHVQTAKGYLRTVSYYPWFHVNEDENDTLSSTLDGQ